METKEYDRIRELNYVVLRHLGEVLGEAEMKVLTQKMNQRHLLPQRVDFRAQERRLDIDDLGADDGLIKVWSILDGSLIRTLRGHKTLLTASLDGFARLYLVSNFNDSTGFALMKRGGTGRQ
eukprot:264347-Amorphochlora_amoeboformis.AAC.1